MKIKNQEIMNFLSVDFAKKHLPIRVGYAILVNVEEAAKKAKAFEEQRMKLVKEHAVKDENGEPVVVDNQYNIENLTEFNDEMSVLRETETEMNVTTVTLDDLAKCDDGCFDSLTVAEVAALNFMIEK